MHVSFEVMHSEWSIQYEGNLKILTIFINLKQTVALIKSTNKAVFISFCFFILAFFLFLLKMYLYSTSNLLLLTLNLCNVISVEF